MENSSKQSILKFLRISSTWIVEKILPISISIMLALFVNNKNQNRIANNIEKQYLVALSEEFTRNKKEVERVIDMSKSITISATNLANWTQPNDSQIANSKIDLNIAQTFQSPPKFIESPGVLNDLISSGNLNKLQNTKLRYLLQEWFTIRKEVQDEEDELWRHRFKVVI